MTGLTAIIAVKEVAAHREDWCKPEIFCPGGLPMQAPRLLAKTKAIQRIITVDGCPQHYC